jgi:hypothetical protein
MVTLKVTAEYRIMLIDPENCKEWAEEVLAKSLEEAEALCKKKAGDGLTEVINVTQKTKTPTKTQKYVFVCWFKTEESQ